MAELSDILADYDFAETIEAKVADGKLTVSLAEAHGSRNREFGRAMLKIMRDHEIDEAEGFTEDMEIAAFCSALLKGWDLTKNGKPVPLDQAEATLTGSKAGRNLFREMGAICASPERFRNRPSKKKPSSTTSRNTSSSARRRGSSKGKPKAAASRSRSASKAT